MKKLILVPSILSADFTKLGAQLEILEKSGLRFIHFDVMDGHFVNNISFGIPVLKSINIKYKLQNDVHLMISSPEKYVEEFAKNGADIITFHYEALSSKDECLKLIRKIKELGCKCGLSIKPKTMVSEIEDLLPFVDLVLVMSVEPGFGGQSFIESSISKVEELNNLRNKLNLNFLIEIDGGIDMNKIKILAPKGVDMFVAGSYVFKNLDHIDEIVKELNSLWAHMVWFS